MKILAGDLIFLHKFYLKWEAEINVYKEKSARPASTCTFLAEIQFICGWEISRERGGEESEGKYYKVYES